MVFIYQEWESAVRAGREKDFCWTNFISSTTMASIRKMRTQFASVLQDLGYNNYCLESSRSEEDREVLNRNSAKSEIIKAILCASLYPNLVHVVYKKKHHRGRVDNRPPKPILYTASTTIVRVRVVHKFSPIYVWYDSFKFPFLGPSVICEFRRAQLRGCMDGVLCDGENSRRDLHEGFLCRQSPSAASFSRRRTRRKR